MLRSVWGSIPTVGSSNKITFGLWIIPHAKFNLLSMPTEILSTGSLILCDKPTNSSASLTLFFNSFLLSPYKLSKKIKFSYADNSS